MFFILYLYKLYLFVEYFFHLVGMFSAGLWGLDSSGGDDEEVEVCWRQNSWNSEMITLLLLRLPCSRGSSWPSTEGEKEHHALFIEMQY